MILIAIVLALIGAVCYAVALVVQQKAASEVPEDTATGLSLMLRLIRRPLWWAGIASNAAGFVFRIAALAFGPVLLVQPLLLMSLVFALPLSSAWAKRQVKRRDVLWASVLALALAIFVSVCSPEAADYSPPNERWLWAGFVVVLVELVVVAGSTYLRSERAHTRMATPGLVRAGVLSFGAGILSGVTATLGRPVSNILSGTDTFERNTGILEAGGALLVRLCTSWEPYALALAALVATVVLQSAFQAGPLTASLPTMKIMELFASTVLATLVLGETLTIGGFGWAALTMCMVAIPVSTMVLSRSASTE